MDGNILRVEAQDYFCKLFAAHDNFQPVSLVVDNCLILSLEVLEVLLARSLKKKFI